MTANASEFDEFLNFFLPTPQVAQDTELLRKIGFLPGLKEMLTVRQVHALEHATVWILSGLPDRRSSPQTDWEDNSGLGGLSTEQGFYLYGQANTVDVRRAVNQALSRITHGEWNLAVHPRCGTNLSVGMLLTAAIAFGFHLVLPRTPIEQLLGFGVAATTAAQLTPELGRIVQQYITTAVPFNLRVREVSSVQDSWGRPAHFVRVEWIDV
ncbi:DUF6391 domain-containing protein [Leptolyngbya boryana CZ1]|jgi:hypothetical protein|uniref:Uncharacterized protein n=2 Tax=Leptolyngbya boryana TaxID=1184 RepID=A0A1Z4JE63_LEPBY|nr:MULTISPECIES: DUF6391 domain-containing protein [Leptolyngbya]BAY55052.1 hypothetical protein NIES2135_18730 [Leptolyngbya boryana NIES-2135]MBD1859581.1 hypothetical protein [Leptolyngbya sp. FACHB-1624]MBD2366032.1 hypothetical protein [Leptolyngbya sp. FACHB-161]MBD2372212.1 hypothetical protein [Leptolyngbya sp. FACHB-238]MBD2396635.1 hypothetical protein [Leptolyngbya sp. FACHB-239]